MDSDYRHFSTQNRIERLAQAGLIAYHMPLRALNRPFSKIARHPLTDHYLYPSIGPFTLWQPEASQDYFAWEIAERYDWRTQMQTYLPIRLRAEKQLNAEQIRQKLGLPRDVWFVCLHVREGGYHKDHAQSSVRNADILNYVPAIEEITKRGGWVIRLGDNTMKPLPALKQVIDYPFTPWKSELMDLYLIQECQFYIGSQSGIWDIAVLFQKPLLMPNMCHWTMSYPPKEGDLGLLKHVYSHSRKRFLSVEELFHEPWEAQHFLGIGPDYHMEENTAEEIKTLVLEYLDRSTSIPAETNFQQAANKQRVAQAKQLFEKQMFDRHRDDIYNKYRIASRVLGCGGTLGSHFLANYWKTSK
ncbi:MAG: TIGR04372 family glycosyltransferase [SAR324 cluster bacterium]|nr:TIGR04372 family glycosyltransferase [SAR324 cluster bacterium]